MKTNEEMRDTKHGYIMDSFKVSRETVRKLDTNHEEALKEFSKETEDKRTLLNDELKKLSDELVKLESKLEDKDDQQAKSLKTMS